MLEISHLIRSWKLEIKNLSSYRVEKINSLLVQEVGEIILREVEFGDVLVTITKAETTEDVKEAKIFISALPFDRIGKVLEVLNRNIYHIQKILDKKLRMKPVPKISFRIDPSIEQAGRIEELLEEEDKIA